VGVEKEGSIAVVAEEAVSGNQETPMEVLGEFHGAILVLVCGLCGGVCADDTKEKSLRPSAKILKAIGTGGLDGCWVSKDVVIAKTEVVAAYSLFDESSGPAIAELMLNYNGDPDDCSAVIFVDKE
jgi:hypothetical protein